MKNRYFLFVLGTFLLIIICILVLNILIKPTSGTPQFIFLNFFDFDYAQFKKAARVAGVDVSCAHSIDSASKMVSGEEVLFIYSMGYSFNEDQIF